MVNEAKFQRDGGMGIPPAVVTQTSFVQIQFQEGGVDGG